MFLAFPTARQDLAFHRAPDWRQNRAAPCAGSSIQNTSLQMVTSAFPLHKMSISISSLSKSHMYIMLPTDMLCCTSPSFLLMVNLAPQLELNERWPLLNLSIYSHISMMEPKCQNISIPYSHLSKGDYLWYLVPQQDGPYIGQLHQ